MGNRRRRRITLERKEILNRRSQILSRRLKEKKKEKRILLSMPILLSTSCGMREYVILLLRLLLLTFQVLSGASLWQIDGRQCRALDPFSILASAQL